MSVAVSATGATPGSGVSAATGAVSGSTYRDRLIGAMASSISEKGYRETTVADVVRLARTSRRTFYEHFADREACLLALFDTTNDEMMAGIAAAVDPGLPLGGQVEQAIDAYIATVTADPELYRSFVRELPGLGDAAAGRVRAMTERFAKVLIELVDSARREQPQLAARPLSADTAVMIVGGMRELAILSMQQGRDVRELRPSVTATLEAILTGTVLG